MSQAGRSHIRARARWREQVAVFIGSIGAWVLTHGGSVSRAGSVRLADRQTLFDVAAVRTAAETMLREAEEHGPVFEDWARSLGMGPDSREPGAFVSRCRRCNEVHWLAHECPHGMRPSGGYPGNLTRRPDCPTPSWAPIWRSRVRFARRVLAALEGQPSECQDEGCDGGSRHARRIGAGGGWSTWPCQACRGTGNNLRGVLSALKVTPQLRRRWFDAERSESAERSWLAMVPGLDSGSAWRGPTRVVPRGEHRDRMPPTNYALMRSADCVTGSAAMRWCPLSTLEAAIEDGDQCHASDVAQSRMPRWRRGELRHIEQRRLGRLSRQRASPVGRLDDATLAYLERLGAGA